MSLILIVWFFLGLVFLGVPSLYYLYMKHVASGPWNLRIDKDYAPLITILIPAHNEEKVIRFKLENLWKVKYPKEKIQVILVDDSSTDGTLKEVSNFLSRHDNLSIKILNRTERGGKSKALNHALKYATGEIVVVSDADCFWSPDILTKGLPYLNDLSVGAVTGLELLLNPKQSWVTQTELAYNDAVHKIRVGESKTYSTIFFQGGFGAYKRNLLESFDAEADDSGTALNIIQRGGRTLLLPEAVYFTRFPRRLRGKIAIKLRRASQLVRIWFKCLELYAQGKLLIPGKIFIPEAFLYLANPFIFVLFIALSIILVFENLVLLPMFLALLGISFSSKKLRILVIEAIQDHLVLLGAIFSSIFKERFSLWTTVGASRTCLSREILEDKGLI